MNIKHAAIIGGDFNTITDKNLDQRGYQGEHMRTKAVEKSKEWNESGFLKEAYRSTNKKGREIIYMLDTEKNRMTLKKGRRLDKILVSQILCSKNSKVTHRRDSFYKNFHKIQLYSISTQKSMMSDLEVSNLTPT